jgi:hypothetical protein
VGCCGARCCPPSFDPRDPFERSLG